MLINIIVPIYHGKKYINDLIRQAEECAVRVISECKVQLILVNDAPEDPIEEKYVSETIDIVILNTTMNRGIHGARVFGFEHCEGDFVLFLDQDDRIALDYLVSQLEKIHDADAVVCRVIHENKEFYTNTYLFENVLKYERMINLGNQIVSPGQVLLRRSSVSKSWLQNIMKHNGADDWLLWLCMIAENRKFALNQEVLFEHVVNGKNVSWDSVAMFQSEDEVYEIILKEKKFDEEQLKRLFNTIKEKQVKHIHRLEAIRARFSLLDRWMTLEFQKDGIIRFLKKNGYSKIAIYGIGDIGKQLIGRLQAEKDLWIGAIDRNAEYIKTDIPVFKLEDFEEKVDLVLVSLIGNPQKTIQLIRQKIDAEVLTIAELLEKWEQE